MTRRRKGSGRKRWPDVGVAKVDADFVRGGGTISQNLGTLDLSKLLVHTAYSIRLMICNEGHVIYIHAYVRTYIHTYIHNNAHLRGPCMYACILGTPIPRHVGK